MTLGESFKLCEFSEPIAFPGPEPWLQAGGTSQETLTA